MNKIAKELMDRFLYPNVPTISYEEMDAVEDFGELEIENGLGFKIPMADPNTQLFRWEMGPGSKWALHKHDCLEILRIRSGIFLYQGVEYGPGRTIRVMKGVPHDFKTVQPGIFYVQFIRP